MNADPQRAPEVRVTRNPWRLAVVSIAVLAVASYTHEIISYIPQYEWLHNRFPFYVAESIDKAGGVALCLLAMRILYPGNRRRIRQALGLSARLLPALVFSLVASSPMLIGFAITRRLTPHIELLPVIFTSVLSPVVEEIEFRGFGARHLQRGTGWPFWVVVWPSALLFGYGHFEQGESPMEKIGLLLLTCAGGVTFAWLVYRWESLWVAIALHICMNLWWDLFSVANTAIGGWFPFTLQNLTMVIAIVITLFRTPSKAAVPTD